MLQYSVRLDRPAIAYGKWMAKNSIVLSKVCLLDVPGNVPSKVEDDEHCFAILKHYRSLMPMAQEASKADVLS